MDWIQRHQVLLALVLLVVLIIVGVVVVAVRALGLYRTARTGMRRVDEPVKRLSSGLADAERRAGAIADGQGDLGAAMDAVTARTAELRVLMDHAGRAFAVLRAPFRYLGR